MLYGLALILLAEGAVDRILVLCPSNTIEDGLLKKFKELAGKGLEFSAPQNQLFTVLHHITSRETGFPSAGHLRMARANWAIPQMNVVCAVSVPVGGAHEETFKGYGT